jgi:glycosyltransferase involved in cell wall biosynthesis
MGVSVIIPTLNAETTLAASLRSTASAEERIVVDGGSTDNTVRAAEEAGASVIAGPRGRGA